MRRSTPVDVPQTLGERIKALRLAKNLRQTDIAGGELSKGFISLLEHNRAVPSIKSLEYIAGKLGVSVTYLLTGMAPVGEPDRLLAGAASLVLLGEGDAAHALAAAARASLRPDATDEMRARVDLWVGRAELLRGRADDAGKALTAAAQRDTTSPTAVLAAVAAAEAALVRGNRAEAGAAVQAGSRVVDLVRSLEGLEAAQRLVEVAEELGMGREATLATEAVLAQYPEVASVGDLARVLATPAQVASPGKILGTGPVPFEVGVPLLAAAASLGGLLLRTIGRETTKRRVADAVARAQALILPGAGLATGTRRLAELAQAAAAAGAESAPALTALAESLARSPYDRGLAQAAAAALREAADDWTGAIAHLNEAAKSLEATGMVKWLSEVYGRLGNAYRALEDHKKAALYFSKSLETLPGTLSPRIRKAGDQESESTKRSR